MNKLNITKFGFIRLILLILFSVLLFGFLLDDKANAQTDINWSIQAGSVADGGGGTAGVPNNIRDNDGGTYYLSGCGTAFGSCAWSYWATVTFSQPTRINKAEIYHEGAITRGGPGTSATLYWYVDLYYSGAWNNVISGTVAGNRTDSNSTGWDNVTAIRVRANGTAASWWGPPGYPAQSGHRTYELRAWGPAPPSSPSVLYYRSDTHTINGLNAYQLQTTNSNTCNTSFINDVLFGPGIPLPCPFGATTWRADVIKRNAGGTETLLGSNVAGLIGYFNGYQSATWTAPQTSLASTDAIKIVEKLAAAGGTTVTRTWITPQLNATQLDAAAWTFVRYTYYVCGTRMFGVEFIEGLYHGCASYNTRIENFSYSTAPSYVDCGFRIPTGAQTITIACEPSGTLTSPLRIRKGDTTYGIVLVPTTDANASSIRIQTSSGIKALRKY